jgi:uncharacterized protein YqjF (DUF2071 family)
MRISLTVSDFLLVSWGVPSEGVRRDLPAGVEPALDADGRALVSLAAFRNEEVRAAGLAVPAFTQLNLRTYVSHRGEPGVLLLTVRAGLPGALAAVLGVPVRPARLRVEKSAVEAPGLGVSLRYRTTRAATAVPTLDGIAVGAQRTVYLVAAGLRMIETTHERFAWETAEPTAPWRYDPVLALGFDVGRPDSVLYARRAGFRFELPARKLEA